MELDPSPSPFVVQKILKMRGTCWALVGWCHLGSTNKALQKFMSLYAAPNLHAMVLRAPSLAEAEAADAELRRQLNLVMSAGKNLDKAIHEVVCVRNSWNCWLQLRPMDNGKGKGKGRGSHPYARRSKNPAKGDGAKKKGLRHGFQVGECASSSTRARIVTGRNMATRIALSWPRDSVVCLETAMCNSVPLRAQVPAGRGSKRCARH